MGCEGRSASHIMLGCLCPTKINYFSTTDCDCHGPGILGGVRVCEGKDGQCPCKNNVGSRRCEHCLDGFYNMTSRDIFGCQGTRGTTFNMLLGGCCNYVFNL